MIDAFENLLEDLEPSPSHLKEGKRISNRVFHLLQRNARNFGFRIARRRISGSVGKNTCISYYDDDTDESKNSDFDLIVFVNDLSPPFTNLLDNFEQILDDWEPLPIWDIKRTSISLRFSCKEDEDDENIQFDLLPAPNFVRELAYGEDLSLKQSTLALEALREQMRKEGGVRTKLNKFYSTAFSERSQDIVNAYIQRDDYYRKVIMLGKYWMSQLKMPGSGYVRAKSFIAELVAIYSQRSSKMRRGSIVTGFRRFLASMANFRNLFVQIKGSDKANEDDKYWRIVRRANGPKIIHPANPYDNLTWGINPDVINLIEQQAKITLEWLNENSRTISEIFSQK